MIRLNEEEKTWLKKNLPGLLIKSESDGSYYIEGLLVIDACYNSESQEFIIFPNESQKKNKNSKYIHDYYLVKIVNDDNSFIPKLFELEGRLEKVASTKNVPICDLHVNPSGNVCLCPKPLEKIKIPKKYSFSDFICKLVIPFFYSQSFFEKDDYWPWGAYSHDDIGILEMYYKYYSSQRDNTEFFLETFKALSLKIQNLIRDKKFFITRQTPCLCNSNLKFRKCHHDAWKGIKQLKIDIAELNFFAL